MVWKKVQKWSGKSPEMVREVKKLRNGLGQKSSEMVWEKPRNGPWGGGGGGQVSPAIVLGYGSLPLTPVWALPCPERPAAPALLGLHVQCSQVAREARTASDSQVLVASPQQHFRV